MARITRIKILEGFETYDDKDINMQVAFRHVGRGLKGYKVEAFPVGTELYTDAPLVLLIGRNGSGKTTLLKKLEMQLIAASVMKEKEVKYFELDHTGELRCMVNYDYINKPDDLTAVISWKTDEKDREKARMSSGQYQWDQIQQHFEMIAYHGDGYVFGFDQPEKDLDIIAKPLMIKQICDYVKTHPGQLFVATHERDFLKVHETHGVDAVVINLLETPAKTYKARDFDLNRFAR